MLRLETAAGPRLCDGKTRREVMRVGGLGMLGAGLGLDALLAERSLAAGAGGTAGVDGSFGRAKSCIVVFLMGGPAQHSTWDPKPDAPAEVRGAFGPIATAVPGMSLSELMPLTARVADRLCILRAVSSGDHAHSSSGYYVLTGRPHQPTNFENALPGPPNDAPVVGSLVGRLLGERGALPPAVTLPNRIINTGGEHWPGQDAGFLGRALDPWLLHGKLEPEGYRVGEIALPAELGPDRVSARRALLEGLASRLEFLDRDESARAFDAHAMRAFDLLRSPRARRAFDLEAERPETQERYGRTPIGQGALLARRLVEAGVRLVQLNWYRGPDEPPMNPVWDTHLDETNRLKTVLVPPTDRALAALVGDLDERGLLDETLVACVSEFGRSPRLEGSGGRGHWGFVFSAMLAGGGIRGGQVYGASDKLAAQPVEGRVPPENLMATILHCLGIRAEQEILDPQGRPLPASRGEVIRPILV